MKNTGIEYLSTERKPHVLNELATLLPPLSEEQRSSLEADLLTNGCYSPIVVNEDMAIVDGHNRQQICEEHDIPYRMLVFAFEDLLEAKQWMVQTQRGRRNLQPWELGKIALKLRPDLEDRAKANMSAGGGDKTSEQTEAGLAMLPNPLTSVNTRKEMAQAVAPFTVEYLDKDATIRPGDLVLTSGLGASFPAGIPVGTVVSAEPDASRLHQRVVVAPRVDFGALRRVFVLRRGGAPGEEAAP